MKDEKFYTRTGYLKKKYKQTIKNIKNTLQFLQNNMKQHNSFQHW